MRVGDFIRLEVAEFAHGGGMNPLLLSYLRGLDGNLHFARLLRQIGSRMSFGMHMMTHYACKLEVVRTVCSSVREL